ncbi:hypothetical protein GCM10020220_052930 [Nonomuraea rubra]|uniref:hypothetical protein n=1 Tax=Nonomuraea rubra TaxID=46180 RepID=UPI0031E78CA4
MKLAVQEQLLPGRSLQEKFAFALDAGFDAIELRGKGDFHFAGPWWCPDGSSCPLTR